MKPVPVLLSAVSIIGIYIVSYVIVSDKRSTAPGPNYISYRDVPNKAAYYFWYPLEYIEVKILKSQVFIALKPTAEIMMQYK
jgi:hypothetical protein